MEDIKYIELSLPNNETIYVEVIENIPPGITPVNRSKRLVSDVRRSLDDSLEILQPICQSLSNKLQAIDSRPQETTVEFGLKLGFNGNAIIASAAVEANFKISLTWKKD